MSISDLWGNSLNGVTTDVIGYRGEFTDFPHDLYSYLSSSIRDDDQQRVGLLYRWLLAAQSYWEAQYNTILGSFSLLSPEECPEEYLDYLKYNVGIHKGLDYIWGTMTENEKRIFIKNYTDFIKIRFSDSGIKLSLEKLTKEFVYLRDFFYYRWILSGDSDNETETQIGRDDDGYDCWSIGDDNYPTGQKPDEIVSATTAFYVFKINSIVEDFPYDDLPSHVYVRCLVTGVSAKGRVYYSAPDYFVSFLNYTFEQDSDILSDDVNQFRVSFESDPFVSDILITDRDGNLNRDMIEAIVRYNRVASERFYIRYYQWIDLFDYDDFFTETGPGTLTYNEDDKTFTCTSGSRFFVNVTGMNDWTNYEYTIKLKVLTQGTSLQFFTMYQDANNYYTMAFGQNVSVTTDSHAWSANRVQGGVPVNLGSGNYTGSYDKDVYYMFRFNCWTSPRAAGDFQKFQFYKDEELIIDTGENEAFGPTKGKVGFYISAGSVEVDQIYVRAIPSDDTYIGL